MTAMVCSRFNVTRNFGASLNRTLPISTPHKLANGISELLASSRTRVRLGPLEVN